MDTPHSIIIHPEPIEDYDQDPISKTTSVSHSIINRVMECKHKKINDMTPPSVSEEESIWTDEIVREFLKYILLCKSSADKCKKSALRHKFYDILNMIVLFLSGTLLFIGSLGANIFTDEQFKYVTMSCGILTDLCVTIISTFDFKEKITLESSACLQLERLYREVQIELAKPLKKRCDPSEYILRLENKREKILTQVGIEED